MRLGSKITASMAGVLVLFGTTVAAALIGMRGAEQTFTSFVEQDVAMLDAIQGMYADGLQGGQAQSAALVEESAAAAESLKTQATQLLDSVAVFQLPHSHNSAPRHPAGAPVLALGAA